MMKKLVLLSSIFLLAACSFNSETAYRTDLAEPKMLRDDPAITEPAPNSDTTIEPKAAPTELSYSSAIYRLDDIGFELQYPQDWMADAMNFGSRASGATFTSWQHSAGQIDLVPEGESILSLTVYHWDPKNDLDAYLQTRMRDAWAASGIQILSEEGLVLKSGQRAVQFIVRNQADGAQAYFLVTLAGDQYLVLSGSGDLVLLEEIALTGRFNN